MKYSHQNTRCGSIPLLTPALNKLLADGLVTEAEAAEKRKNILEDL